MWKLIISILALSLSGCAVLYHAQVGEIDNRKKFKRKYFDFKVSESGVNLKQAGGVAKIFTNDKGDETIEEVRKIIALFQQGPKTGQPVYNEKYARNIIKQLRKACPSGRITGLTSIRESRNYPVITGEIVKVTGYCLKR